MNGHHGDLDGAVPAGSAAARGVAYGLTLAAAPTFAVMALLTMLGGGASDILCVSMPDASPLTGMAVMYGLMSAFHLAPWLKLIARRRGGVGRARLTRPPE